MATVTEIINEETLSLVEIVKVQYIGFQCKVPGV